ncbi:MAG: aspartate--tRNA(Asn) ligase [Alphaproteobacteria bacterium]|nr:aspartate--tRNA(Asn) ligase [Alphaproteobacteria bacterium]
MSKIRTHIAEISQKVGETITIKGHAQTIRAQSSIAFIVLREITGTVQCVVERGCACFDVVKQITTESVISVTGTVVKTPSTESGFEIHVTELEIISKAEATPIPVTTKGSVEVTPEKAQDWRFLSLRSPRGATIMRALSAMTAGYHQYLEKQGFIEIQTPKIMATPSESRAELFKLEYFGQTAYLAQSPQLFKQMAIASGLERVFEVAPAFRADHSFTTRHATEFTSFDGEMAYIESFEEVMSELEQAIRYMLTSIKKTCGKEIEKYFGISEFQLKKPIPRITMARAKEILREMGCASEEPDITTAEEKALGEYVKEHYGSDFVYITEWPWEARPFYHKKGVGEHGEPISVSADLLYKGVEIVTCAQREESYEKLCEQLREKGLHQEGLRWYLECFRYGMPPHGGWGFGGARFIKQLLELPSLRESTFLFRGPTRLMP